MAFKLQAHYFLVALLLCTPAAADWRLASDASGATLTTMTVVPGTGMISAQQGRLAALQGSLSGGGALQLEYASASYDSSQLVWDQLAKGKLLEVEDYPAIAVNTFLSPEDIKLLLAAEQIQREVIINIKIKGVEHAASFALGASQALDGSLNIATLRPTFVDLRLFGLNEELAELSGADRQPSLSPQALLSFYWVFRPSSLVAPAAE